MSKLPGENFSQQSPQNQQYTDFATQFKEAMNNIEIENKDKVKIVEMLLTEVEKRDPNLLPKLLQVKDQDGNTPLHLMASDGTVQQVKSLVEMSQKYTDPELFKQLLNSTNNLGNTPLHTASEKHNMGSAELLVNLDAADLDIRNKNQKTALNLLMKNSSNKKQANPALLTKNTAPVAPSISPSNKTTSSARER